MAISSICCNLVQSSVRFSISRIILRTFSSLAARKKSMNIFLLTTHLNDPEYENSSSFHPEKEEKKHISIEVSKTETEVEE